MEGGRSRGSSSSSSSSRSTSSSSSLSGSFGSSRSGGTGWWSRWMMHDLYWKRLILCIYLLCLFYEFKLYRFGLTQYAHKDLKSGLLAVIVSSVLVILAIRIAYALARSTSAPSLTSSSSSKALSLLFSDPTSAISPDFWSRSQIFYVFTGSKRPPTTPIDEESQDRTTFGNTETTIPRPWDRVFSFLVTVILFCLPLLIPFGISVYLYYVKDDRNRGRELSANIHVVLFSLLFLLMFLAYLIVTVLRRFLKQACLCLCVFNVLSLGWFTRHYYSVVPHEGFNGLLMINNDTLTCHIPSAVHVLDMLPLRSFNFFTGSSTCAKVERFATLKNSLLTINCPSNAYYIQNPAFHLDRVPDAEPIYRVHVRFQERKIPYTPGSPVRLLPSVYHLSAYCEGKENYFVHIAEDTVVTHAVQAKLAELSAREENKENEGREVEEEEMEEKEGVSEKTPELLGYDVEVLLFDSTSRPHLMRSLPKTAEFLEKHYHAQEEMTEARRQGESFSTFQFFRYHAVGTNTDANIHTFICGQRATCDANNLIWKKYRDEGYVTLWSPGLCQNYFGHYFGEHRTNFTRRVNYPYPHIDMMQIHCHPNVDNHGKWSNFDGPYCFQKRCIAGQYHHTYVFNFLRDFHQAYRNYGTFSINSFMEAHEGTLAVLNTVDEDLLQYLKETTSNFMTYESHDPRSQQRGRRERIVVIMADHGSSMFPTEAALIEHRLPVAMFLVPNSLLKKHPEMYQALAHNEQSLFSGVDIYWTFREILSLSNHLSPLPNLSQPFASKEERFPYPLPYPNLFQPLPYDRNCSMAQIPEDYCMCNKPGLFKS